MAMNLGRRIAPPRFVAYAIALACITGWALTRERLALPMLLAGFDIATWVFFLSLTPLFRVRSPKLIARHAMENDANRVAMLIVSVAISAIVFGALVLVVSSKSDYSKALVIVTLATSWVFVNVIYALHYAHLYYRSGKGAGGYAGGLSIPSTDTPDYFDFLHFSLILGMTFQTADIDITSTAIRRVSTWHCLESFVFNIGILAFSINMIASS